MGPLDRKMNEGALDLGIDVRVGMVEAVSKRDGQTIMDATNVRR
jgi:hypothetical protein